MHEAQSVPSEAFSLRETVRGMHVDRGQGGPGWRPGAAVGFGLAMEAMGGA